MLDEFEYPIIEISFEMKLKIGDLVRCINSIDSRDLLREDWIYEVTRIIYDEVGICSYIAVYLGDEYTGEWDCWAIKRFIECYDLNKYSMGIHITKEP